MIIFKENRSELGVLRIKIRERGLVVELDVV